VTLRRLLPPTLLLLAACDLTGQSASVKRCLETENWDNPALALCTRALEDTRDDAERAGVHLRRGSIHRELGHAEEAAQDFARAIALDPRNADAYVQRAYARMDDGDFAAADADLAQAARLAPENAYAKFAQVVSLERQERYAEAIAHVEGAILLFADDVDMRMEALAERCWIRAVLGVELDAALRDCDAALGHDADQPEVWDSRGLVNYRLGDYAQALEDYDESLDADGEGEVEGGTNSGGGHYMRGLAKRALGQVAAGDADIAQGLRLDAKARERYARYGVAPVDPPPAATTQAAGEATAIDPVEPGQ
jgi:tetratricopeptide (TPR) repeat protein